MAYYLVPTFKCSKTIIFFKDIIIVPEAGLEGIIALTIFSYCSNFSYLYCNLGTGVVSAIINFT
jgi:hypothetical protein